MRLVLGFILAMAVLIVGDVFAQTKDKVFEGAKTYVAIGTRLKNDRCKYSSALDSFKYPISSTNLEYVLNRNADLHFIIDIEATEIITNSGALSGCAFHIDFSVRSAAKESPISFNGKNTYMSAVLINNSHIGVVSSPNNLKDTLDNIIEKETKKFITQYNIDNK
jgi:hypothetical protein